MSTNKPVWMIEKGQLCVGLCKFKIKWVTFTSPEAMKFESENGAWAFVNKNKLGGRGVAVREHLFVPSESAGGDNAQK